MSSFYIQGGRVTRKFPGSVTAIGLVGLYL
jgi:hypothetical protein